MTSIRKVKTANGATGVQIVHKQYGRVFRIEYIGSAHTKDDLDTLLSTSNERLIAGQQVLFAEIPEDIHNILQKLQSRH